MELFLRFSAVGVAGFLVDTAVLYLGLAAGLGPYVGRAISYVCASTTTWYLNRRFTFHARKSPRWAREPLTFLTELLAAIPSIVYGLWGIFVLVPLVRQLEAATPAWLRAWPLLAGPPLGIGMLAAGLILAVMIVPFTSAVAREVLKTVPAAQR